METKIYSPNDASMVLQIKPATLRKYSALLENYGYHIERNTQRHRYYQDKDIVTIRDVIRGSNGGATLEESIKNVISMQRGSNLTNDTYSDNQTNDNEIEELKTMIQNQTDVMKELIEKLDDNKKQIDVQQQQINQQQDSAEKREQLLLETINKQEETKKGFFSRLFGKK